MSFIENPTARSWYRAHSASIVAACLEHRELARQESKPERFFLNLVLVRVLYAHASPDVLREQGAAPLKKAARSSRHRNETTIARRPTRPRGTRETGRRR